MSKKKTTPEHDEMFLNLSRRGLKPNQIYLQYIRRLWMEEGKAVEDAIGMRTMIDIIERMEKKENKSKKKARV